MCDARTRNTVRPRQVIARMGRKIKGLAAFNPRKLNFDGDMHVFENAGVRAQRREFLSIANQLCVATGQRSASGKANPGFPFKQSRL